MRLHYFYPKWTLAAIRKSRIFTLQSVHVDDACPQGDAVYINHR